MPGNGAKRREFTVVVERDEDGYYVASVPALPGCHTQARSLDELMQRVQEAIAVSLEDGESASAPQLEFIGVQRISVPA
jgi:predicted RNase H-like HicB family nuclease